MDLVEKYLGELKDENPGKLIISKKGYEIRKAGPGEYFIWKGNKHKGPFVSKEEAMKNIK